MNQKRQPSTQQFVDAVEQAFGYLVTEFAFSREPPPMDSRNLRVAYSSDLVRIVVEGTNWGLNTRVAIGRASREGRFENFDLNDLIAIRGRGGQAPPPQGTIEAGSTQLEQIPYYAKVLKTIGSDILMGDFSVFPALQAQVDKRARALE